MLNFIEFILDKHVQLRAQKEDIHAEKQPQHQQYNGGKAAVDVWIIWEIFNIYRIKIREHHPARSRAQCAGKLRFERDFLPRQDLIHRRERKRQNDPEDYDFRV